MAMQTESMTIGANEKKTKTVNLNLRSRVRPPSGLTAAPDCGGDPFVPPGK